MLILDFDLFVSPVADHKEIYGFQLPLRILAEQLISQKNIENAMIGFSITSEILISSYAGYYRKRMVP